MLVLPERAIRVGGSGAEILRLVAEKRTVESILSAMRERYPDSADRREMAAEILGFLEASEIPGLEFWSATDRSVAECWSEAPGMQAYRGIDWMPEPCRGCPEKERDFGGCRCQAFRLLGDASATDPACSLSSDHDLIVAARDKIAESWQPRC